MKNRIVSFMLVLLAVVPGWAGLYDEPNSLTSYLVSGGPGKDGIPALTNPEFASPDFVTYVADDDLVIGVYMNGVARAYPENLGWWHEIINDRIGDQFISATLCPLTGTAMVFEATDADGSQIEFGVSGLLINSNLVMFDRRGDQTLYPQMIYTAINSSESDQRLELLPAVETTWAMWRKMHPDTQVAQAGTGWGYYRGNRPTYPIDQYTFYPYISRSQGDYRTSNEYLLFLPSTNGGVIDSRHQVKDVVLGICQDGETKAFPFAAMPDQGVINDLVGNKLMVILFDADSRTAIPYYSQVDDRLLSFYAVEPEGKLPVEFMDVETGSRWNMLGEAVAGPLMGKRLEQVPAYNAMWFAWAAYWPETEIWDGEGVIDEPPMATAVEEELTVLPAHFLLGQNVPNPFNPETQIQYELPFDGPVRLTVYNAAGQKVRTLVDGFQTPGIYLQTWNGRNDDGLQAASGTYLYRLELPESGLSESRIMTLLR